MPRFSKAKRDANEPEIVSFYRGIGAYVQLMHEIDRFDLLVVYRGTSYIVEVKDPIHFTKKDTPYDAACKLLTKNEKELKTQMEARNCIYHLVWGIPTAKKVIGL